LAVAASPLRTAYNICAVVAEDDVINHVAMDRAVGVEIVHLASPQADVASPELISNERAYSYVRSQFRLIKT
jgi:hypothetical protein